MKKVFIAGALLLATLVSADYIEVKTGNGRTYYDANSRPKLYVCYDRRVRFVSDGLIYLRYDGCARYTYSCARNGKARFGKYPSVRAARNALYRCRTANPRFVD